MRPFPIRGGCARYSCNPDAARVYWAHFFRGSYALLVGFGFILNVVGVQPEPSSQVLKIQGATMGTHYHIAWVGLDAKQAPSLQVAVDERLQAINKSMSTFDPQSELSRLNKGELAVDAQGNIALSADLTEVLAKSLQIWQQSAGKFDITVGPLVNLWGFGPEARIEKAPEPELITERLAKIGSQHLKLDSANRKLHLDSPQYVDLSAIAKGWGVDQIALLLENRGIQNYMVEIGGEIRTKGQKSRCPTLAYRHRAPDPQALDQQAALIIAPKTWAWRLRAAIAIILKITACVILTLLIPQQAIPYAQIGFGYGITP